MFLEFKPSPQNSYLSVAVLKTRQEHHLLGVGFMMELGSSLVLKGSKADIKSQYLLSKEMNNIAL